MSVNPLPSIVSVQNCRQLPNHVSDQRMGIARVIIERNGEARPNQRLYLDATREGASITLILGHYEGQIKNSMAEGRGIFDMGSQGVYIGSYENGMRNGIGMWIIGGISFLQKWEQGQLVESGIYSGPFKAALPHGLGMLTHNRKNEVYCGKFKEGLYHGLGTILNPQGVYIGRYKKGCLKGNAVFESTDKKVRFEGEWNGLPNGQGVLKLANKISHAGKWCNGWFLETSPPINYLGKTLDEYNSSPETSEQNEMKD